VNIVGQTKRKKKMEISRIQPNCSEVAMVVYPDKMDKNQLAFVQTFLKSKRLSPTKTPKGNLAVECDDEILTGKESLWRLKDALLDISEFHKMGIEENTHFDLMRDESYFDMIEEGSI
jgi:hypothetical protein